MSTFLLKMATVFSFIGGDEYYTNFTTFDSSKWIEATNCMHCDGNGKECTQETVEAITFGSDTGAIITTSPLKSATKCGALCQSGHLTFDPILLYCHITVIAKWYPYTNLTINNTYTGEGFIGLDSNKNIGSITFGFHGDNLNWPYNFTTDLYSNSSNGNNIIHHKTQYNLALDWNKYEIIWTDKFVEWKINDESVMIVNDTNLIPNMPMQLRLHSRSHDCQQMTQLQSFSSQFRYFDCMY